MIYICHICFYTEWRTQYTTQLVWTEGKRKRKGNWNGAHNPGGESKTWAAQLSCWTRWRRQIGPIWQFWVRVCGLGYNKQGCLGTGVPNLNTRRNIVYLWTHNMTGSPLITSKCFFPCYNHVKLSCNTVNNTAWISFSLLAFFYLSVPIDYSETGNNWVSKTHDGWIGNRRNIKTEQKHLFFLFLFLLCTCCRWRLCIQLIIGSLIDLNFKPRLSVTYCQDRKSVV